MSRLLSQKHILVILFLSILLIGIWFRHGNIMGAGETGLPFYNTNQLLNISCWSWGTQALGNDDSLTVSSCPFFLFFSTLQNIGIPGFALQAFFYFCILFATLYSMFKLTDTLLPRLSINAKLFASLFYLFNLYSLMNIWNRNLPNTIVFYALLPFLMSLFIKGLKSTKYIYAVYGTLLTAILSYAFGAPAQTVIYWLVYLLIAMFYFLFIKKGKFVFRYLLVHFPLWVILNFWWISQEFNFRFSHAFTISAQSFFSDSGNKYNFDVLSQTLGQLNNLFLLKHGTFFRDSVDLPYAWPLFYSHPVTLALQWLIILLILFIAVKKIQDRAVGFLLLLFIIGIFAAKGNSGPLGEVFDYLFQSLSFLQFFRNPFEKLGILLPLSLAPLFGLTVATLSAFFHKKNRFFSFGLNLYFLLYLVVFMGIFYWTSLIFSNGSPSANDPKVGYEVKPPDYYQKANEWLSKQNGAFRFITYPLGGEGIFYKWPKGYVGIELSGVLFTNSSISYITSIPYFAETVQKLEKLFLQRDDFYKIAGLLNAKYILLRPDINEDVSLMRSPKTIKKILGERIASPSSKLKFANSFGPLELYSFDENAILPKIFAGRQVITSNRLGDLEDFFYGFGNYGDILIYNASRVESSAYNQGNNKKSDQPNINILRNFTKTSIVHTEATFFSKGPTELLSTDEPAILPYTDRISSNLTSSFINFKEKASELLLPNQSDKAMYEIMLLGKRLEEAQKAIAQGNYDSAAISLSLYQNKFPHTFTLIQSLFSAQDQKIKIWRPDFLALAFGTHLTLLKDFERVTSKQTTLSNQIKETENLIYDKLIGVKILSKYRPIIRDNFPLENRFTYQFSVSEEGEYEIILPETNLDKYFSLQNEIIIQMDDKILKVKPGHNLEGQITLGKFNFNAQLHEISLNQPPEKNLASSKEQVKLKAVHDDQKEELKMPISDFDPYSAYKISFDYYVRSGIAPKLSLLQNNDKIIKGKQVPVYEHTRLLPLDNYWFDFRNYKATISSDSSADFATVYLSVDPWNDCQQVFQHGLRHLKCKEDPEFKKTFDRTTEVYVKNLILNKVFTEDPFLRKVEPQSEGMFSPVVDFKKIDQTKYLVSIKNAQQPFVLVFSDLFNSEWKAYLTESSSIDENSKIWKTWGQKSVYDDKRYLANGFANSWLIDKNGDFNLILEFWPQRLLYIGYLVSAISIASGFGYILWLKIRRRQDETAN